MYILDGTAGLHRLALRGAFVLLRLHTGPSWCHLSGTVSPYLEIIIQYQKLSHFTLTSFDGMLFFIIFKCYLLYMVVRCN